MAPDRVASSMQTLAKALETATAQQEVAIDDLRAALAAALVADDDAQRADAAHALDAAVVKLGALPENLVSSVRDLLGSLSERDANAPSEWLQLALAALLGSAGGVGGISLMRRPPAPLVANVGNNGGAA